MPEYHYSARDEEGKRFAGRLEADNRNAAMELLSERFAYVTRLEEKTGRPFFSLTTGIRGEDLLNFSQTLAAMLDGGIPLKRALDTIYGDTENRALRLVIMDMSTQLGGGAPFSAALSAHTAIFDSFFINMVKAGESAGEMPEMLNRVADYIEKTEALKDKVKSALTYPVVVVVFAGILVCLIMAFGIPYLRELYGGLGIELPFATRMVVAMGGMLADHKLLAFLLALGAAVAIRLGLRSPTGEAAVDRLKLSLPPFAETFRVLYTARFARTLSLLYASGVPLLDALQLTASSAGNSLIRDTIKQTQEAIKEGKPLSECLRANPYFVDTAVGMVAAGEESGQLERMLNKVADFYEQKVYTRLDALTATLEPVMMVLVGIGIGGVIITLGMPFMNLASVF
ncbi:MAG: type II secretion system F family protein [Vulcanimicrobiota bacterium]